MHLTFKNVFLKASDTRSNLFSLQKYPEKDNEEPSLVHVWNLNVIILKKKKKKNFVKLFLVLNTFP